MNTRHRHTSWNSFFSSCEPSVHHLSLEYAPDWTCISQITVTRDSARERVNAKQVTQPKRLIIIYSIFNDL